MLARAVPKLGGLWPRSHPGGCRRAGGIPVPGGVPIPSHGPPAPALAARPFEQVPGERRGGWLNLYHFWQEGGLHNVHNIMARKFQRFGPIYR